MDIILLLLLFLIDIMAPVRALAVQVHGGMEGLIVHLLGHFLFSGAILFILVYLARHPMGQGRAWRFFRCSMWLFLLWNVDTMANHILAAALLEQDVMIKGFFLRHYVSEPLTSMKWAYYITSFDHLLCVPAMLALFLSMREFMRGGLEEDDVGMEKA